MTGPACCQKEAAIQNTSDQTNQFPVAMHKSHMPGLFGTQGLERLETARKAFRVLVQLELPVKDEPVLLMEELRQSLGVFLVYIYIFYTALCHVHSNRYFFCRE